MLGGKKSLVCRFRESIEGINKIGWTEENLGILIREINGKIVTIGHEKSLIDLLLSFDWLDQRISQSLQREYSSCMINIITAHCWVVEQSLDSLIRRFNKEISDTIHKALSNIVSLVPSCSSILFRIIVDRFPHKRRDREVHECFVNNLIRVSSYCVSLSARILEICIDKIIGLDVEIKLEDMPDDDDDDCLQFELENDSSELRELAEKLDVMMGLTFKYIDSICSGKDEDISFGAMIRIFDAKILHVYKSKYTQFLMFFICKKNLRYQERFIGYLINKISDENGLSSERQACAAYLGSFVSRANYLSLDIIKQSLSLLASWAHSWLDFHPSRRTQDDLNTFYTVCQNIFYISIFHWASLSGDYIFRLDFQRLTSSAFTPLLFCSPPVAEEFSRCFREYSLKANIHIDENDGGINKLMPTPLIDKTVHLKLPPLHNFFPFDPYLLKTSSCYIADCYRQWSSPLEEDELEESQKQSTSTPVSMSLDSSLSPESQMFQMFLFKPIGSIDAIP